MKKIAIIGCGIMGAGMAQNLLSKGFTVFVWNRTKKNVQALLEVGAIWADTPAEATKNADVIFEVTANDASSENVWLGHHGIVAGADATKYLIMSATTSASWVDRLAAQCSSQGLNFFDIALTGGRAGAESGQLTLLAGGEKDKLNELQDVFSAISKKLFYFGKTGSGMRYKLLLNMLQATHIIALGEALKVANAQGMDMETVGQALCERPGGVMTNLAWESYKTQAEKLSFSVEWIVKDLTYAKALSGTLETPLLDDVLLQYVQAIKNGKAQSDWMAIIQSR